MNLRVAALSLGFLLILFPAVTKAQTNCQSGNGPLSSEWPAKIEPDEIARKFTANETTFKAARQSYTFTQDVTVQTLQSLTRSGRPIVDGEFRQTMEVSFDSHGNRAERVTYAPQSTLRRISIGPHDLEDLREIIPFAVSTADLPQYEVKYMGQQRVDQLDTFVFDVTPKSAEKGKRYFSGRVWVENRDLAVVKTCGKIVSNQATKKSGKGSEDVAPSFVTYREQIDHKWLPTYIRSDDFLFFSNGYVRIREIVKYSNYKRTGSNPAP